MAQPPDLTLTPPARPLTLLFAMHVESGHVCSAFQLAGSLRQRGHRVVFLGMQASERLVVENGYEFIPFAEDILPAAAAEQPLDGEPLFRAFLKWCVDGRLDERILRAMPDAIICDSLIWYIGLRGLFLAIPVVNFVVPTIGCPEANVPPSVQARIPGPSRWNRATVRLDWLLLRGRSYFPKRIASRIFGSYRAPHRMHHLMDVFLSMARQAGVPRQEGVTYRFTEYGPQLILPEIALPPKSFEFPGADARPVCHLGNFADPKRNEDTHLLDCLDAGKPLVYCSLGSASRMYPHARRFFRAAVEASRLRPDWQWVVAAGGQPESDIRRCSEGNLTVTDWAPQISILERAKVMVTHGGIGSVIECIWFGVPMVIVPGARDQPGNMARAVYHGIALQAKMGKLTAKELAEKVEQAMTNSPMRAALEQMKVKIIAENGLKQAIGLIESTARAKGR